MTTIGHRVWPSIRKRALHRLTRLQINRPRAAQLFNKPIRERVGRCPNPSDIVTKLPAVLASVVVSL